MLEFLNKSYMKSREQDLRLRRDLLDTDTDRKRHLWQRVLHSPAHIDLDRL